MSRQRHAKNPLQPDFTLCGIANDVAAIDRVEEPPVFADIDDRVACTECRRVIDWCQTITPNYRVTV